MIKKPTRSWAEIDLQVLRSNYQQYCLCLKSDQKIMAVVKADAYGHGVTRVVKVLLELGVDFFAVSNLNEAIEVRSITKTAEILILGYTALDDIEKLIKYNITQTLLSEKYAELIAATGKPVKCQFALDTGMHRIGIDAENIDDCERIIRTFHKRIILNGIFTHLAVADSCEQNSFTCNQIDLFESVLNRVSDLRIPYCHCLNSAGGLWHESGLSDYVRLGIVLYGLKPDFKNILPKGIKPALTWKSVVSMVKKVKSKDTIGYGRTYSVDHPMTIATIPTGYADGYPRLLSNKGWVIINGQKAPIVGQICMDQMMVDVTNIQNVDFETEVILIGDSENEVITADDLAQLIGTIGYEIVCGISKRVERIYID